MDSYKDRLLVARTVRYATAMVGTTVFVFAILGVIDMALVLTGHLGLCATSLGQRAAAGGAVGLVVLSGVAWRKPKMLGDARRASQIASSAIDRARGQGRQRPSEPADRASKGKIR
ncbi:hypothetical protein [Burkholderia sp. Ac-20365]|uniref:hypothetical protein n=1 Tax=Burkholderia sp. Ac-20365 TaxID=2703897 RepID=UPI00197BA988|nr:hypothetical protein [Burkholderia sp. Ac-20365]